MSDTAQTDGVIPVAQDSQTQGVPSATEEVSISPSEGKADDVSLNFDDLLSTTKKTNKEERQGLSRRELAELKRASIDKEYESDPQEEDDETPLYIKRLEERFDRLEQSKELENKRKESESVFKKTLETHGVSANDFKETYQQEFISTRDELLEEGVSMDKAVKLALKTVLPIVKSDESNRRSEGRKSASLPPSSTREIETTTYRASSVYALAKTDPDKFRELKHQESLGKIKIMY